MYTLYSLRSYTNLNIPAATAHTHRYPVLAYPKGGVSGASRDKERETPSIRVKLQHQVVSILPLKAYEDFIKVRLSVCLSVCLSGIVCTWANVLTFLCHSAVPEVRLQCGM